MKKRTLPMAFAIAISAAFSINSWGGDENFRTELPASAEPSACAKAVAEKILSYKESYKDIVVENFNYRGGLIGGGYFTFVGKDASANKFSGFIYVSLKQERYEDPRSGVITKTWSN